MNGYQNIYQPELYSAEIDQQGMRPQGLDTMQGGGIPPEIAQRLNELKQTDPAQYEQIMSGMYRDYAGERGVLKDQAARAEALRSTPSARGRHAGGMYIAANPLEHLGTGLSRYKGYKDLEKSDEERLELSKTMSDALRGLGGMFTR